MFCPAGKVEASRRVTERKERERAKRQDRAYDEATGERPTRAQRAIMAFQEKIDSGMSVRQIAKEQHQRREQAVQRQRSVEEAWAKRLKTRVEAEEAAKAAIRARRRQEQKQREEANRRRREQEAEGKGDDDDEEEEEEEGDDEEDRDESEYDDEDDEGDEDEDEDEEERREMGKVRGRARQEAAVEEERPKRMTRRERKQQEKAEVAAAVAAGLGKSERPSRAERNKQRMKEMRKKGKARKKGQRQREELLRARSSAGTAGMDKRAIKRLRREGIDVTDGAAGAAPERGMRGFALEPPIFVGIEKLDRKLAQMQRREQLRAKLQAEINTQKQ